MPVSAAEVEPQPLFESNDTLAVTLTIPWRELSRDRLGESEYRQANLSYVDPERGELTLPIEIRTRGKTRRRRKTCEMPPLRVKFDQDTAADTLFASQRALKLVTYCQDKSSFDQYVVLEYLAYRIQNLLTDYGQRVRLVQVTYVDERSPTREFAVRYGIFLEHWRRVAQRTGTRAADVDGAVMMEALSAPDMGRIAVFNYLIGNDDWSAIWPEPKENCCHNTKPLFTSDGKIIPMPYDFDFAGMVDAPYAVAKPPNRDVRKRTYRGLCVTQTDLSETLPLFFEQREAIYDLVRNQAELRESKRKSTLGYFDRFYDVISDPQQVQRRLVDKCRKE